MSRQLRYFHLIIFWRKHRFIIHHYAVCAGPWQLSWRTKIGPESCVCVHQSPPPFFPIFDSISSKKLVLWFLVCGAFILARSISSFSFYNTFSVFGKMSYHAKYSCTLAEFHVQISRWFLMKTSPKSTDLFRTPPLKLWRRPLTRLMTCCTMLQFFFLVWITF